MNKGMEEIFDSLSVEETAELLEGMGQVKTERASARRVIKRTMALAGRETRERTRGGIRVKKPLLIAAALALIIALGAGTAAYAAEAKQFGKAKAFFEEYDLSMEGLTRAEIKAVCRDISSRTFTYGKTGEVLSESLIETRVPGWEIVQTADTSDPEDVSELWEVADSGARYLRAEWWKRRSEYEFGFLTDAEGLETGSFIERRRGEELLWRQEIGRVLVNKLIPFEGGVIALGEVYWDEGNRSVSRMLVYGASGEKQWETAVGVMGERICAALRNSDGSFAVFSRPDMETFCFTKLSADGKLVERNETETGNMGVGAAAPCADGYIVQLFNYFEGLVAGFAKVDEHGNITARCSYDGGDRILFLRDLTEYGGRILLSAYSIPNDLGEAALLNHFAEVKPVMQKVYAGELKGDAELARALKERYTALLLILDPDSCELEEFFSVKGGMGAGFKTDQQGKLIWSAEMIEEATSSIAADSFRIAGRSRVFEYRFDESFALLESADTGEYAPFKK